MCVCVRAHVCMCVRACVCVCVCVRACVYIYCSLYSHSTSNITDDPAMYEDYLKHDMVKFKAADEDNDGKLSQAEFPFFMYPEQHQVMSHHVVGVSVTMTA